MKGAGGAVEEGPKYDRLEEILEKYVPGRASARMADGSTEKLLDLYFREKEKGEGNVEQFSPYILAHNEPVNAFDEANQRLLKELRGTRSEEYISLNEEPRKPKIKMHRSKGSRTALKSRKTRKGSGVPTPGRPENKAGPPLESINEESFSQGRDAFSSGREEGRAGSGLAGQQLEVRDKVGSRTQYGGPWGRAGDGAVPT